MQMREDALLHPLPTHKLPLLEVYFMSLAAKALWAQYYCLTEQPQNPAVQQSRASMAGTTAIFINSSANQLIIKAILDWAAFVTPVTRRTQHLGLAVALSKNTLHSHTTTKTPTRANGQRTKDSNQKL